MLLWNLDLLLKEPLLFLSFLVATAIALLVAITLHEFSHALAAHQLGDTTASRSGRLSLNPLAHLDPLGTLMLFVAGFGWGKPVPVNPYLLQGGPRRGMALVALAGPLANLAIAGLAALPIKLGLVAWHSPLRYAPFVQGEVRWLLADIMGYLIFYSIILAIFNLIPLAPLDGFNAALGVLPQGLSFPLARLAPYGPAILLLIITFSWVTRSNILWRFLGPAMNGVAALLVGRAF